MYVWFRSASGHPPPNGIPPHLGGGGGRSLIGVPQGGGEAFYKMTITCKTSGPTEKEGWGFI